MKRLVICADGTWNRPEKKLGKDYPTNVLKVARAISHDEDSIEQSVFYDWGVGSYIIALTGGAFGVGLSKNVMDAYRYIVHNYQPGDELYFFGFSRGSYTIRSLCGFINNCGILKQKFSNQITTAYRLYRNRQNKPNDSRSKQFKKDFTYNDDVKIHFVGVWDTVGALGIPFDGLSFLNEPFQFHDAKIGPNIQTARHALSIDELRDDYKPTIWKERPDVDIKQVWFAGVHTDIGGSYPPDQDKELLSDIPLSWMLGEATKCGLELEQHIFEELKPSATATKHNEYKGFFKILGKHLREIPEYSLIHSSVKERFDNDSTYRPQNLVEYVRKCGWKELVD
ncbi:MAG: DUF2235 domain-containing protein [Desulfovibrio sp.]